MKREQCQRKNKLTASQDCSLSYSDFVLPFLNVHFVQAPEWYKADVSKGSKDQELKLKIAVRMDKPMNMKHCG